MVARGQKTVAKDVAAAELQRSFPTHWRISLFCGVRVLITRRPVLDPDVDDVDGRGGHACGILGRVVDEAQHFRHVHAADRTERGRATQDLRPVCMVCQALAAAAMVMEGLRDMSNFTRSRTRARTQGTHASRGKEGASEHEGEGGERKHERTHPHRLSTVSAEAGMLTRQQ